MSQGEFPATLQKVYVLQPSSFLQKKFADNSLKFLKDDIKFKVSTVFSVSFSVTSNCFHCDSRRRANGEHVL